MPYNQVSTMLELQNIDQDCWPEAVTPCCNIAYARFVGRQIAQGWVQRLLRLPP